MGAAAGNKAARVGLADSKSVDSTTPPLPFYGNPPGKGDD